MTRLIERFLQGPHDRCSLRGRLGLRVQAVLPGSAVPTLAPIRELELRSESGQERAQFHESSGIYGFLALSASTHTIRIVDPKVRFLPSRHRIQLDGGQVPILDIALLPAFEFPLGANQTALWGEVQSAGVPASFARVEVQVGAHHFVTHADETGRYLLWLWGLEGNDLDTSLPELTLAAQIRFHRRVVTVDEADPTAAIPVDFDQLSPQSSGFADAYAELLAPVNFDLILGRRQRFSSP